VQVLTVRDAAQLFGVDEKTVYRLIERDGLPAFKVGRQWRLRASDLEAWIDGQVHAREAGAAYAVGQTALFAQGGEGSAAPRAPKLGFSDSAFTENADLPVHRWVPWIAGFSAKFVQEALDRYLPPDRSSGVPCVLDPFAGVGTTLFTAMLSGCAMCGFEINPYAAEACELKLRVHAVPLDELGRAIDGFESSVGAAIGGGAEPLSKPPRNFTTRVPFFSPLVERKVLLAQDYIAQIEQPLVRQCFRVALASEIVGFSNYSYEPSLGTRAAAGKKDVADAPVVQAVAGKLRQMLADIRSLQRQTGKAGPQPHAAFFMGNFFELHPQVPDQSVDLVVTSPPYLNNYHYIRNSRPQVYWLGLAASPDDLRAVEEDSFGKFWQTVRCDAEVPLGFAMPELEEPLTLLRSRNASKGPYGGPGWANYAATYFNDCRRFALILSRVLRPGGKALVVLGNSILQGVEFRTDLLFGRICQSCGLGLEETVPLRKKRTGTSIIQSAVLAGVAKARTTLYESAVVVAQRTQ
jgi:excisionase family DNA binding protein